MTFKTEQRWWIEVEPMLGVPNETRHTMVKFEIVGRYFTKFACSCGAQSDNLPSLRPENKCVVCGDDAVCNVHALDDYGLCKNCEHDFDAWREMQDRYFDVYDFLREKLNHG